MLILPIILNFSLIPARNNENADQEMIVKSDNRFAWISAQPLLEPLLNMHAPSYMSVITYLNMLQ